MAGLDGIERKLEPPPALEGLIYEQPEAENCPPLPRSFDAAIEHLADDAYLNVAMGEDWCASSSRSRAPSWPAPTPTRPTGSSTSTPTTCE